MGTRAHADLFVTLVVAAARNGVIGRDGQLPWSMPSDLKLFRRLTLNKPIIMGRKTFAAIGRPLDKRDNIVVTRRRSGSGVEQISGDGVYVAGSVEAALQMARDLASARGSNEVAVIGGGEIYLAARPFVDRIYLTMVDAAPEGDAFFELPDEATWRMVAEEPIETTVNDQHAARLLTYDRIAT